ncbi:hypothetical protein PG994_009727 [Apiospora phragmitis]|uniref:P-loop containing nucleoside triphosphate hydrolase protein n=1 Tax=Apiospora phragmitis TaxID=2905665 RepID=A0ABR1U6W6_9PEZI
MLLSHLPDLLQGSLASGEGLLCVGLPRTGTLSMAIALKKLGYRHVHHGLKYPADEEWAWWRAAADAHFGQDHTAVTDFAGVFAPQLISTYPNAKVILIIRPFDPWIKSVEDTLLKFTYAWDYPLRRYILDPLCGGHMARGMKVVFEGWLEADNRRDARANALRRYDEQHELVRRTVPPERLLEYRMGDGWEPLAKFLGKDIPLELFPHVIETSWIVEQGRREEEKENWNGYVQAHQDGIAVGILGSWILDRRSEQADGIVLIEAPKSLHHLFWIWNHKI